MRDQMMPPGDIVSDIKDFSPDEGLRRDVSALTGGFPCQAP